MLIALCAACKHREHKVVQDHYSPGYSSQQLQETLSLYYKQDSKDSVNNFLIKWHQEIMCSSKDFVNQNDTLENIFLVFTDLYKPFRFGDYNTDNYFEGKNNYIVIQNEIKYDVVSDGLYQRLIYNSSEGYPNDTAYEFYKPAHKLLNFRPQLSFDSVKCLYLTAEYKQAINDFLGLGTFKGDILNNDTILNRYNFLSPALPIFYGHWGGYWHIETFPIIERIIFDSDFEHAAVDFRYGLEETMLQYRITKIQGHWQPDNKWLKVRLE